MPGFWIRISGGLLLLLQATLLQFMWRNGLETAEALTIYIVFTILTAVAALAAAGFFLLYQSGWLLAMMVQGLALFVGLFIYFTDPSPASEATILYSIIMVLYLNSFIVRATFGTKPDNQDIAGESR